jgi:hypothetical protein
LARGLYFVEAAMCKKVLSFIVLILVALTGLVSYAVADSPRWEEFCPYQYCNAVTPSSTPPKQVGTTMSFIGRLLIASGLGLPIGLPIVISENRKISKYQGLIDDYEKSIYWAGRRMTFGNTLRTCEASPEESKTQCYMMLRMNENQLNNSYHQMEQQKQIAEEINAIRRRVNSINTYTKSSFTCNTFGNTTNCY